MLQKTLISTAKYINFYYWEAFLLFPKALPDLSDVFIVIIIFQLYAFVFENFQSKDLFDILSETEGSWEATD